MIRSRWANRATSCHARSDRRAGRARSTDMARSISPASRTSTGRSSTPNDGATAWIAAQLADLRGRSWIGMVPSTAARVTRRDLLEQLQPFAADAVFEHSKAGGVAARPRQAVDEAGADRVGDTHEHDRHSAGRLLQQPQPWRASGQDDVGRERDQFRRVLANALASSPAPSGSRSARCGRRSSPVPAGPAGTPRCGPVLPDRPRRGSSSTPMRRIRSACCARAASGHAAAAPPSSVMNSRRFMCGWPPPGKR